MGLYSSTRLALHQVDVSTAMSRIPSSELAVMGDVSIRIVRMMMVSRLARHPGTTASSVTTKLRT